MRKIKIKIQLYTLECIVKLYNTSMTFYKDFPSEESISKEFHVTKDILDELYLKLQKKVLEKSNANGPFVLSMKYHQAWFLEKYVRNNLGFIDGNFEQNLINEYINKIHQNL